MTWGRGGLRPEALAVARVANRVANGGHVVPERKVRERFHRVWPLVATAIAAADRALAYDNSRAAPPFRLIASFEHGTVVGKVRWPKWAPTELRRL